MIKRARVHVFCASLLFLLFFAAAPAAAQSYLYVANLNSGSVSVIDTETLTVVATIPVGIQPVGIEVLPDGSRVYVANQVSGTVSVIDSESLAVEATIPVGGGPSWVAVTPDGSQVWVSDPATSTVTVIDAATNAIVGTVTEPGLSLAIKVFISADGLRSYVYNQENGTVCVIDPATLTVVDTFFLNGLGAFLFDESPDGSRLYVTQSSHDTVAVVDTATLAVLAAIPVGDFPTGIDVTEDGSYVYVATLGAGSVDVIDTTTLTVVDTIPLPLVQGPLVVADVAIGGDYVYVSNDNLQSVPQGNAVAVIDTSVGVVLGTVAVGGAPFGLALTPANDDGVGGGGGEGGGEGGADHVPYELKADVLAELIALPSTGSRKDDKRIAKAIDHLAASLDAKHWATGSTLTASGKKVFEAEKKAVKQLGKVKSLDLTAQIRTLVTADRILAQTAIDQATAAGGNARHLSRARKEMDKALREIDRGRMMQAINRYKLAWKHAQKSLR